MRKITLLFLGAVTGFVAAAQNPATTFTIPNRHINLPCGTTCTSISASVPHIKQSNDYVLTRPAYVPFAYTTAGGNEMVSIYTDDVFSPLISLPFPFCFYGSTYNSLVMGSNAIITFDATNANTGNAWPLTDASNLPIPIPYAGGTQGSSSPAYYPRASIMGPYNDIYPTTNGSGQRKIEWRIEGVSPQRRFVGSYNSVPMFSCTTTYETSQMVIYESTGIVEVYVHDKPLCSTWNSGLAILGVQNFNQDKAVAAEGKNCTAWGGSTSVDSCYRFIPSAGASSFVSAQLLVNGTVVATGDTSTTAPGVLHLNFPNICPTLDSTAYVLRVAYSPCGTSSGNAVFTDTVFVKKTGGPTFTTSKTDGTCTTNGTITVTVSSGTPPYEYSKDGGTTWQSSNVFTNVTPGTYNITARTVGSTCAASNQPVTISLINNLTMTVAKVDATCTGGSITITPAGGTGPFQYSINGGTTFQGSNVFSGLAGGTYNVLVKDANGCTASQSVTLAFTNNLTMNNPAGSSICLGGSFTPSVVSNAASYSWTPAAGVSNTAIANPVLSPQATTTYTVTGTLGTCTIQRTLTISVSPGAFANAGPDATIISGDVYQMQGSGAAGTYLWTPSAGLSSTSILTPTANPTATTTYTLRVTTGQGCFATDDVTLTVVPYCVKPMEAFTPNGDGINDLWLITNGNCLVSATAQVFNRYGAKVFESNDYKNTWDGTYKGKPLPDGTYYYVISFRLVNGKAVLLKGNVTILR